MTKRHAFGLSSAIVAVTLVGACGRNGDGQLRKDLLAMRARTLPRDGKLIRFNDVTHDAHGAHASWEIETAMDGPSYERWVATQLNPEFTRAATDGPGLTYSRLMQGDAYQLSFEVCSLGPPLVLKISFFGYPT